MEVLVSGHLLIPGEILHDQREIIRLPPVLIAYWDPELYGSWRRIKLFPGSNCADYAWILSLCNVGCKKKKKTHTQLIARVQVAGRLLMSGRQALHLSVTEMFPRRREFSKTFDLALISAEKLTRSKIPPRSGCNTSEDSLQMKCF